MPPPADEIYFFLFNRNTPKFIALSHAKKLPDIYNILGVVRYGSFELTLKNDRRNGGIPSELKKFFTHVSGQLKFLLDLIGIHWNFHF